MARLPIPGNDVDNWGIILNEFLRVAHNEDGTLKNTYEVINVLDYGARRNDETVNPDENTLALQNAINAAADGGIVFVPSGIYVTGELTLPSHITLVGEGTSSVLRMKDGNNANLLTNQNWDVGNKNIVIQDLRLEGNRAHNSSSSLGKAHGIDFEYVTDSVIENVYATDFFLDGIYLGSSASGVGGGSSQNIIHKNRLVANGRTGISITRGTRNTITNNILQDNARGVFDTDPAPFIAGAITIEPSNETDDVSYTAVKGNQVISNNFSGIQIIGKWTSRGILIVENIVVDNGGPIEESGNYGIGATSVSHLHISGNHVSSNKASGIALGLGTGVKDTVICGNTVRENGGAGILVNGGQGGQIALIGNISESNSAHGIIWVQATAVALVGNIAHDNLDNDQIRADGVDPVYTGNITGDLSIEASPRVVRPNDIVAASWRMYTQEDELYVENPKNGEIFKLLKEKI